MPEALPWLAFCLCLILNHTDLLSPLSLVYLILWLRFWQILPALLQNLLLGLMVLSFGLEITLFLFHQGPMNLSLARLFWLEIDYLPVLASEHQSLFLLLPLLIFVFMYLRVYLPVLPLKTASRICLPCLILIIFIKDPVSPLPTILRLPALLILAKNDLQNPTQRLEPFLTRIKPSKYKHLIFVMDETIRSDALNINPPNHPVAQILKTLPHLNFGTGYSSTTCSSYSNLVMMSGIQAANLPDIEKNSLKWPLIFAYAKKAGFKTFYLEGQGDGIKHLNFLDALDYASIDQTIRLSAENPIPRHAVDPWLAKSVKQIVESTNVSFQYVLKAGAHSSYDTQYPPEKRPFTPVISQGLVNQKALINSYCNAVDWSVNEFFKGLEPILARPDVLIVYTSDHGENFEGRDSLKLGHCQNGKAPSAMAKIPVLFLGQGIQNLPLSPEGTPSHFQVFTTLLDLMGYDPINTRRIYGPSLFETPSGPPVFFGGDIFDSNLISNIFDANTSILPAPESLIATGVKLILHKSSEQVLQPSTWPNPLRHSITLVMQQKPDFDVQLELNPYSAPESWILTLPHQKRPSDCIKDKYNLEYCDINILNANPPLYMAKLELAQKVFTDVLGFNPSPLINSELPVSSVKYTQALSLLAKLEAPSGLYYDLPSEQEWELAACLGMNLPYFFGNDARALDSYAWFEGNAQQQIRKSGQKKPNPLGLFDLFGNVWEWTKSDYFAEASEYKTLKGGGYMEKIGEVNCQSRSLFIIYNNGSIPLYRPGGLRLVLRKSLNSR